METPFDTQAEKSAENPVEKSKKPGFLQALWANSTLFQKTIAIGTFLVTVLIFYVFSYFMDLRTANQAEISESQNPLVMPTPKTDPKKEDQGHQTNEYDQRRQSIEAKKLEEGSTNPTREVQTIAYEGVSGVYEQKAPTTPVAATVIPNPATPDEKEALARSKPTRTERIPKQNQSDWVRNERTPKEAEKEGKEKEGDVFNTLRATESPGQSTRNFADRNPTETANSNANTGLSKRKKRVFIAGVVHGTQTIHSGQSVRFRLIEDATIEGIFVPKHTLISALGYLSGNRVTFQVSALQLENQTLPVKLITYDQDMNIGLAYDSDNPIQSQTRSETEGAVDQGVNDALSYVPYAGALNTGKNLARGVARAVSRGGNQKKRQEIALLDGYKVYFTVENTN